MSKIICPMCYGNGYRKIWKDTNEKEKIEIDCTYCNNQGEVDITEQVIEDLDKMKRKQ